VSVTAYSTIAKDVLVFDRSPGDDLEALGLDTGLVERGAETFGIEALIIEGQTSGCE